MQERVQAAVYEIDERRRVLSEDHGGTPEERHALADAMNILWLLRNDVTSRQDRQDLQSREALADKSFSHPSRLSHVVWGMLFGVRPVSIQERV
jgi:hypothetical protein